MLTVDKALVKCVFLILREGFLGNICLSKKATYDTNFFVSIFGDKDNDKHIDSRKK